MASKTGREKNRQRAHALDAFIEAFLRGDRIREADLDKLRKLTVPEDQRIDYKEAAWTAPDERRDLGAGHPRTLKARVSKYVGGFANGIGGVLVIGMKEERAEHSDGVEYLRRLHLDAIVGEGKRKSVVESVRAGLEGIIGHLPRSARVVVVDQEAEDKDGFYIVVGTGRARRLVPCVEKEQVVYYLRLHDSTVHAPDYLMSDLVLGHRQQPNLTVEALTEPKFQQLRRGNELHAQVRVQNVGLQWVDSARMGLVAFMVGKHGKPVSEELQRDLRFFVHSGQAEPRISPLYLHEAHLRESIGPMDTVTVTLGGDKIVFPGTVNPQRVLGAALYIVGKSIEPMWWQVIIKTDEDPPVRWWVLPCGDRPPVVAAHDLLGTWKPEIEWVRFDPDGKGGEVPVLLDE